jgi:hypothetical protein
MVVPRRLRAAAGLLLLAAGAVTATWSAAGGDVLLVGGVVASAWVLR